MTANRASAEQTESGGGQSRNQPGRDEIAALPFPVEEIGAATRYSGREACEYGCGRLAEYSVRVSTPGDGHLAFFGCGDCLRSANVPLVDVRDIGE